MHEGVKGVAGTVIGVKEWVNRYACRENVHEGVCMRVGRGECAMAGKMHACMRGGHRHARTSSIRYHTMVRASGSTASMSEWQSQCGASQFRRTHPPTHLLICLLSCGLAGRLGGEAGRCRRRRAASRPSTSTPPLRGALPALHQSLRLFQGAHGITAA